MGQHGSPEKVEHAQQAHREALRGAISGSARYGLYSLALSGVAFFTSPLYRGLTVGFRMYLFMALPTIGALVEADHRLRDYEQRVRQERRAAIAARQRADEEAELQELLERRHR